MAGLLTCIDTGAEDTGAEDTGAEDTGAEVTVISEQTYERAGHPPLREQTI